jgi:hypothetical protein
MNHSQVIRSTALMLAAFAGTVAAQEVTADALHKLMHAGRFEEMTAKADSLSPDDPVWKKLMDVLVEAAEQRNDFGYLKRKAQEIMLRGRDAETRATAAFALGIGYWKSGQFNEATTAYSEVTRIMPVSELAAYAEGNIHEIKDLRVGQLTPHFIAQTTGGGKLDSNDLRGKTVLLNFWASW